MTTVADDSPVWYVEYRCWTVHQESRNTPPVAWEQSERTDMTRSEAEELAERIDEDWQAQSRENSHVEWVVQYHDPFEA